MCLKKIWVFFIVAILVFTYNFSYGDSLSIVGESAILIDGETGQILYEKNAYEKHYPASTTKIMTGILAIELGNVNDIVVIDEDVINATDGTHIALDYDEEISFKDLLHALLIESANDAAAAIAKYISGNINDFATLMNEKAKELGALDTHFTNPSGLPDENHFTTAYDLALIAKYAMSNDAFKGIVSKYDYTIPPTNKKDESRYITTHNKLLYSNRKIDVDGKVVPIKYEGVNGVKNGYTQVAQQCLVSSATRDNRKLICVVLKSNGNDVYSDTHKLLNYGFNEFEKVQLSYKNEFINNFDVINGSNPMATGIIKEDLFVLVPKDCLNSIEKNLSLTKELKAPIKKGQVLGTVEYKLNGDVLGQVDVVSTMDVGEAMIASNNLNKLWILPLVCFLFITAFIRVSNKSKRSKRRKRKNTYQKANDPIK